MQRSEEFAARVEEFEHQAKTLRSIIGEARTRLKRELGDVRHWPAEGWDFGTADGTLEDMLPGRTEKQWQLWATDDMDEHEDWLEGPTNIDVSGRDLWDGP